MAIQFIKSRTDPLNSSAADKLEESLEQLLAFIKREDRILFEKDASDTVKKDILHLNNTVSEESPLVKFQLSPLVKFKPKICDLSNGWDLPLQESIGLKPMEYKKVDLGVKIILPKHYCALLMNKSSARVKYGVHVFLGLIDVGYHNFLQTVIQNVSGKEITLPAGIAVAQLLVFESRIPKFELGWDELESRNGSFGSTGNDFEKLNPATDLATNMIQLEKYQTFFKGAIDILNPYSFKIGNMNINLLGNLKDRTEKITELLDLEWKSFSLCNVILKNYPIKIVYQ